MGKFPGRPAYPRGISSCNFAIHGPEHKIKPIQGCLIQESQVETERLESSHIGSTCSDKNKSTKTQTDLRRNIQHVVNMTKQRTTETS